MKNKKLKLITEILAILIICLVSFVGVYGQNANKMVNKVKGYDLAKDLKGYRELVFSVSDAVEVKSSEGDVVGNTDTYSDSDIESYSYTKTENKVNSDENLTLENYKKCKEIIENRLKSLNVEDYNLSLNTENGTINLQIPEDNDTDHTASNILQVSKFEIRDSEDSSNVFITNDNIKNISSAYNTTEEGTTVYLQILLDKDGANKLKELSTGEYATKPEEENTDTENDEENQTEDENAVEAEAEITTEGEESNESTDTENEEEPKAEEENSDEENADEEKDDQKKIVLAIDRNDMITTSFDEPINDGVISLSMGQATKDSEEISDQLKSTSTIALLVKSGKMPLTYKVSENNYVNTDITQDTVQKILIVIGVITLIGLILFIKKYKLRGLIAAISYIGFIALYLLVVRYTNVEITLEGITASVIILIINYILTNNLLKIKDVNKEEKSKIYLTELKSWIIKLLPIFIISIIFVFIKWTRITSFGMNIFWGIILSIIYSYLLTRDMLEE